MWDKIDYRTVCDLYRLNDGVTRDNVRRWLPRGPGRVRFTSQRTPRPDTKERTLNLSSSKDSCRLWQLASLIAALNELELRFYGRRIVSPPGETDVNGYT